VTDSALANQIQKTEADPNQADIQALLEELENKLRGALDVLSPSVKAMCDNLEQAAADIRKDKDATMLWGALNDLQVFLSLVQQICTSVGTQGPKVVAFDNALGEALGTLETVVVDSEDPEEVALFIENSLIRSFDAWADAEAELRQSANV
jgi:G:T/U-mismatch repair DNA glycosylase